MMVRIAGVVLPPKKRIIYSLPRIFGVGMKLSSKICEGAGVDPNITTEQLSEEQVNSLREEIEKRQKVEGELRREISLNIKRLKDINSYRGIRHARGLPTRGQRTKTNSRTVRGNVRRTMGSGRRAAAEKT